MPLAASTLALDGNEPTGVGASLTAAIVTVTVAVAVPPWPSDMV